MSQAVSLLLGSSFSNQVPISSVNCRREEEKKKEKKKSARAHTHTRKSKQNKTPNFSVISTFQCTFSTKQKKIKLVQIALVFTFMDDFVYVHSLWYIKELVIWRSYDIVSRICSWFILYYYTYRTKNETLRNEFP